MKQTPDNTMNLPIRLALISFAVCLALCAYAPRSRAANANPPGKMTFQGFLTDASTPPVPLGSITPTNKSVIFKIYRGATPDADVVWAESQVVTVDKGHFSVLLGEGSTVNGFETKHDNDLSTVFVGSDASERWLGITLDGAEIKPRIQFFAAPYAQLAKAANSLVDSSGNAVFNAANGMLQGTSDLVVTGKVGIGTTASPIGPLQVFNPAPAADAIGGSIVLNRFQNSPTDQRGGAIFSYYPSSAGVDALGFAVSGLSNPLSLTNVKMVLTQDGKLGIGTVAPTTTLDVNGAANVRGNATVAGNAAVTGNTTIAGSATISGNTTVAGNVGIGIGINGNPSTMLQIGTGANQGPGGLLINSGWINQTAPGENRPFEVQVRSNSCMVVNTQGYVGIGTSTPEYPLEVAKSRVLPGQPNMYSLLPEGPNDNFFAGFYSIVASEYIGSKGFVAWSDARIKKIVGPSDTLRDLETIQKLRVTDYRMVDYGAQDSAIKKGFIAQEVEAVIPEAVTSTRQFVPDINSLASSLRFEEKPKTLALTLTKPHGLKPGDQVRVIADELQLELNVKDVPSTTDFVVENVEKAPKQVFIFGKKVSDFRSLNYDRIFSTGIGAIQELARQMEALKKSEARIAELEQKVARMAELELKAARVDSLEREWIELKRLVLGLAPSQASLRE